MENGGLTLNAFQRKEYSEFSFIHDEMDKIDQKKKNDVSAQTKANLIIFRPFFVKLLCFTHECISAETVTLDYNAAIFCVSTGNNNR